MAAVRTRNLTVNGIRSPCLESGGDASEAVVFVHGNPGCSEDWRDLIARVGEFGRAVAFDMPGFAHADKPRDFDYSVPGYATHLEALLRELKITRVHLVLHDFGGPWGLAWAAQHAARVASVTLFNIGILPGYRWHYLARIWRIPILGELFMRLASRAGFHAMTKHGNPRGLPRAFVDRMYDTYDAGTKRAVLKLYRATGPALIETFNSQVIAALKPYDIPALVVWGARDPYVPVRFASLQHAVFPRVRVAILPDSGHWPFADDPEAVAAHVVPFLKQQRRRLG
jgi:pimeloyl-ACP methyl ester carboxylesterase